MADEQRHTLELIAGHLIKAAQPLADAGTSLGAFMRLMGRLGFFAGDVPPPYRALATSVGNALTALESVPDSPSLQDLLALLDKARGIYDAVQQLRAGPVPTGADAAAYAAEIGERLFELLLTDYLAAEQPTAYNILAMLNVIETESIAATPSRPAYVRTHFRWEELPKVVSDPGGLPKRVYRWGEADFRDHLVLEHLGALGLALGLPIAFRPSDEEALAGYLGTPEMFPPPTGRSLILPFFYANVADQTIEGALALQRLPANAGVLPGLILEPRLPSQMPLQFDLAPSVQLKIRDGTNLGELFGVTLTPPDIVSVRYPLAPGTPPPAAGVGIGFTYTPQAPVALLGDPKATRIELKSASAQLGVDVTTNEIDFHLGAELDGLKIVIAAGEGDSFLRAIVGDKPASIDVPLGIEWSRKTGIHFKGSAAFEVALYPLLHLGPLSINSVTVKLSAPSGGAPRVKLDVGVGIAATLGPVGAVIQGIGLSADTTFQHGNAGSFDFAVGFKSPDGIGLAIDASAVSGGGFLAHDEAKHEYSGVVQLEFIELQLQGFGLITTQVAGGAGYSLLVLVDAEFPPVQLGWGFTLNGVGGLLAIDRTASTDALHAALKAGQLSSILFPKSAITNAPAILGQLDALFPTAPGRFLFGPMALIGWGTPPMLKASIAVVIELPEPVRVILLARIEARLPDESHPLVRINMDALGVLDLGQDTLSFDAVLFDSKLIDFTLSGAMALRATWARPDQREFLLAIGGVHPRFTPPAGFPALPRITIDMPSGHISKLRLAAYLAVTSNSIQFGADLDVFLGVSGFGVSGHLGFDALLQRNPFRFDSDISGKVAITAGGDDIASVDLEGTFSGPRPYHLAGQFKVHIVFFDVGVSFDYSWGGDLLSLLAPAIDVGALLGAALAELDNWDAPLPEGMSPLVSTRRIDKAGSVLAHPLARPGVHERIVPLGLAITRYGEAVPSGTTKFAITAVRIGGVAVTPDTIQDDFAPAQFFELSEDEKLQRPSFEQHAAGVRVAGGAVRTGTSVPASATYETFFVDTPGGEPRKDSGVVMPPPARGDLVAVLQFGAAGLAATGSSKRRYQTPGNPIRVAEPAFVLADKLTMAAAGIGPAAGATFSEMHALLAGNRNLQIVATHEMTVH